jgi:hypothetical protein
MARRTEEQEQEAMTAEFPYRNARTHPAWAVIEQALQDLAANNDLELRTPPRYVIGYLIESLVNRGLLPPHLPASMGSPSDVESQGPHYIWAFAYQLPSRPKREKTTGRREGKIKSASR